MTDVSTDGRPARRRICVFCGSNPGNDPAYTETARALGKELVARDIGLVFGGGRVGLMGKIADTVMAAGGEAIGVIPQHLEDREIGHGGVTELLVVGSMHERKAKMADLSEGFIALAGGIGTFEEMFEVLTWSQLGIHDKPVGLLDTLGFYEPLLSFLDHAAEEGFLRAQHRDMLHYGQDPAALLDAFASWRPRPIETWTEGR